MTRVVAYYDCDEITPQAVVPDADVHVRRADVAWVDGESSGVVATVPSHRDPAFLADLVAELDRIAGPARSLLESVDLAEVALYEWVYAAAPVAHRAWVAARLDREYGAAEVRWVTGEPASRPRLRRKLSQALRLRHWQRAVRRTRASAREARQPVRPLATADQRLLLIDQYPHTARLLAAVGATAAREHRIDVLAVGTDDAVAAACEPLVAAVSLVRVAPRSVRRRARRAARAAARIPYTDALFGHAAPGFAEASHHALALAARNAVLVQHVLGASAPSAIATTSIVASSARSAALLGRARGLPCSWVQHGILRTDDWKTRYVQDRFLCWGERDRRKLVAAGVDAAAITVTGSSQFEHLGARAHAVDDRTGSSDVLRVLYLPSRSGGNLVSLPVAEAMVRAVAGAVAQMPEAALTVKPHPGDSSHLFDDLGPDVTVARGADLVATVLAADVVVVATSTAGLEACALDRPVVALAFEGIELAGEYGDQDAAVIAHDASEVADALAAVARADVAGRLAVGRKALVDDMFDGLRPGSARRCAAELGAQAGSHGPVPAQVRGVVEWFEAESVARWGDGSDEPLPSWRDPAWRDDLGDLVDAALPLVENVLVPAEVLDAGRYDWIHDVAPIAHRAWVLQRLLTKGATDITWYVDGRAPAGLATALRAVAGGQARIEVRPSDARPLAAPARPHRRAIRSFTRPGEPTPPPGGVLFVEAYPRGASVSAQVAADLPDGLVPRWLTTSAEIDGVLLHRAATRRARVRAELAAWRTHARTAAAVRLLTDPARSPWQSAAPALRAGLDGSLAAFVDAARTTVLVDDVVARWQPAVVASSTGAPALVRAAAAAAHRAGRHSVFLQHGLLLLYRYRRHLCHDVFVVWGRADRRQLLEAGVADDAIRVCGAPQFDAIAARPAAAAPASRVDGTFRVLYLPSRTGGRFVTHEQAAAMLNMVDAAVPPWADLRLKPHPSDPTDLFQGRDDVLPRDRDAIDEIIDADVVVIATSTVGVEAAALGRPVIILGLDGVAVPEELTGYQVATVVTTAGQLTDAIRDIRDSGVEGSAARAAMVDDMFAGLAPGAAGRAAAVVAAAAADARFRRAGSSPVGIFRVSSV